MKKQLLADHIGCDVSMIRESNDKKNLFQYEKSDYLILTCDEANEEAKKQINDSLWSLEAALIRKYLKTEISIEIIEHVQTEMCANCTFLLLSLIEDLNVFLWGSY